MEFWREPAGVRAAACEFVEVESVDIHKFADRTWEPSKVESIAAGFDAAAIERHLLEKYGPAYYRFSAIVGERTFAWRTYGIGDVKEPPNGTAEARDETAVTAGQTMRDLASHLKASLSTAQLSNLMADLAMARTNPER